MTECKFILYPLALLVLIIIWFATIGLLMGIAAEVLDYFNPIERGQVVKSASEKKKERRVLILPLILVSVAYWIFIIYLIVGG
jgi:hypothetical protein